MKYRLIACEIFARELCAAVAKSPHRISLRFLPFRLHQEGGKAMAQRLQKELDDEEKGFDATLLAYCLCNNGLLGLRAKKTPLVAFRSHDCIACLLGDRRIFDAEHAKTPGTYWLSAGWIEQANDASDQLCNIPAEPSPDDPKWKALLEKYGEDNALFLWEEERKALANYERLVYIDTGLGPQESFEAEAQRRAETLGLRFEKLQGNRRWIEKLLEGDWDESRFIVVQPGQAISPRYDGSIACAEALP